jgi:hypothetical protein
VICRSTLLCCNREKKFHHRRAFWFFACCCCTRFYWQISSCGIRFRSLPLLLFSAPVDSAQYENQFLIAFLSLAAAAVMFIKNRDDEIGILYQELPSAGRGVCKCKRAISRLSFFALLDVIRMIASVKWQ